MFSLIAVMNMSDIRDDYYDSNIYGSLFSIINGPILATFNLFLIPVFSWMCFKKRNWFTLIQGLYLFGYSSLGGGRFGFVRIGVGLLFVGFCLYLNKYNKANCIAEITDFIETLSEDNPVTLEDMADLERSKYQFSDDDLDDADFYIDYEED